MSDWAQKGTGGDNRGDGLGGVGPSKERLGLREKSLIDDRRQTGALAATDENICDIQLAKGISLRYWVYRCTSSYRVGEKQKRMTSAG